VAHEVPLDASAEHGGWAEEVDDDPPKDVPNGHQEEDNGDQQPPAVQEVAPVAVPAAGQDKVAVPAPVQAVAAVPKAAPTRKKSVREVSKPTRCSQRLMDKKAKVQKEVKRRSCRTASKVATKRIAHCFSKEAWIVWDRFCPTAP